MRRTELPSTEGSALRRALPAFALLAGVLTLCALVACGGDDDSPAEPDPPADEPAFPADYRSTYTEVRGCRQSGQGHLLDFIVVHANSAAAADYLGGSYPLEEGAILVKTLHSSDDCDPSTVTGYAVMIKGPAGTDPATNDWIWQDVTADREVRQEGLLRSCSGCHSACTSTDYLCTEP